MPELFKTVLCIMVAFSFGGSLMVVIDKYNAVHKLFRISESTLFVFGICGGALLMFFTMKLCHHKIRKQKFMVTFPLLAALQVVLLFLCYK